MGKRKERDGSVFMRTHIDFTETGLGSFQTNSSENGGEL